MSNKITNNFDVYLNPFSIINEAVILFHLKIKEISQLVLYDVKGSIVFQENTGKLKPANHSSDLRIFHN
ncbi:hypothetical protein F0000_04400 [Aquimarina sp. RZ0]|nr:hypothetical protein F0000_04400 [Aquimarina sp. RZ0]